MRELLALGQWEYEARRAETPSGAHREDNAGENLHSEAEGRPKGDGVSRAGEFFPRPPGGVGGIGKSGSAAARSPAEKRKRQPNWLPFRFVDQTLRISNLRFLEGLLHLQSFIDGID